MLIGARDESGIANVFDCNDGKLPCYDCGEWDEADGAMMIWCGEQAEPFCQNIPNGQSRVIDLSKSTIVHDEPERSAVELAL